MKKVLLIAGLAGLVAAGCYFAYDHYYGVSEEGFVCGQPPNEITITFSKANRDGSILGCHACVKDRCEIGRVEDCVKARRAIDMLQAFGACRPL